MLSMKLPTLFSNYVLPLRRMMKASIDGNTYMRFYEMGTNIGYTCLANEPRFSVVRYTTDHPTFIDRIVNVVGGITNVYDMKQDVSSVLLPAIFRDQRIGDILRLAPSDTRVPYTMLYIVNEMAGDYSDVQRMVAYGMGMYSLLIMYRFNGHILDVDDNYRRPPMDYLELLMRFFCDHPEFVGSICFQCIKFETVFHGTYIRFVIKLLKAGPYRVMDDVVIDVPNLRKKSMFKNFIDKNVRMLKKEVGPAPPAKKPKPQITGQAPTTRSRAAAQSSLNASI
jgi:hypothetical protein